MKKTILPISVLLLSALGVMAQGTLNYSIRVPGSVVGHVYGRDFDAVGTVPKAGNTIAETPVGTQTYFGGFLTGSGYSAQLFYALGLDQPESSLVAAPDSITTFRTSATLAGTIATSYLTLRGTIVGGGATLQLRAWDNAGGTFTSWAEAEHGWLSGNIAAGKSAVFNISGLTDFMNPLPPTMTDFRSFNLYGGPVPEPSTYALLVLGALGLWIFRRNRNFR